MAAIAYPELIEHGRDRSGDPTTNHLAEYYSRLGAWCDVCLEEGIGMQQDIPELKGISNAIDYLCGVQWKESLPSYRAKPVSNEILAMFWETIGLLTDIKPMFNITDIGGAGTYSKTQEILNALAKGWTSSAKFEKNLSFITMYGMLTTAPAKIYWNPQARGTSGDPSDGDISIERMSANQLLRLGTGDDLQDDECVIYRKVRTLAWIKRAFPTMGVLVRGEESKSKYTVDLQAPVDVMPNFFQGLSPAAKRMMGGSDKNVLESVFPKAEVQEFWKKDDSVNESGNTIWMGPERAAWRYQVKPGQKLYPRGRLIIRSNRVTLYDEPNPYYHRKYPFAQLGLQAVPWQQFAMSVVHPWISQQDILNQIMAGMIQCVKKAINPPLIAAKSAIHPEAMRAIDSSKPGLKITYSQNSPAPPSWGQPPNVPAYVMQSYGTILQSMKQSSGSAAMDGALKNKQTPGGDTLDRITFSKNTPIRFMGRNLEDFTDDLGNLWTPTALQFYDAAHRMELLGDKGLVKEDYDDTPGSLIPDGVDSESFVRRWRYKSDKGTLLNVQRQDRIQVGFALRKNHDLSRKGLYKLLDWNIDQEANDAELAKEAEAIAKAQAAAGPKKGGGK